jgi:hypothetical protein
LTIDPLEDLNQLEMIKYPLEEVQNLLGMIKCPLVEEVSKYLVNILIRMLQYNQRNL